MACLLTVVLAVGASTAQAGTAHQFLFSFDGAETEAKAFVNLGGVAVDRSAGVSAGDVYVTDEVAHVVDKFDDNGGFLGELKGTPGGPFVQPTAVAVDPTSGDLYVGDETAGVVDRFTPAGGFVEAIALSGEQVIALAVDATTGDVYIETTVHEGGTVWRFDPASKVLSVFVTGTAGGPLGLLRGIAVDNSAGASAGDVYVADKTDNVIDKFNSAGEQQLEAPEGSFGEVHGVAVDPATGDVYVTDDASAVESAVDQFTRSGVFVSRLVGSQTPSGSMALQSGGVAFSASGDVLIGDQRNKLVDVLGPDVVVPDAMTLAATEVAATTAMLNGRVKPDEVALTSCEFELVPQEQFGGGEISEGSEFNDVPASEKVPCEQAPESIPTSGETEVGAQIKGLAPGVTYHYRLIAANKNGEGAPGAGEEFSTPPPPSIDGATVANLVSESADLVVKIDPNGSPTHYHIEYEADPVSHPGEFTSIPVPDKEIGEGTSDVIETRHIAGLKHDIAYHWRVVATNANGTTVGKDHVFVYPEAGVQLPDNRAYEMVTPVHKNGALIGDAATGGEPEIATGGDRLMAESIQCFAGAESCNGQNFNSVGSPYAFTRTDAAGGCTPAAPPCWHTISLALPASEFSQMTLWGTSAQAGTALFSAPAEPFGEDDFYARALAEDGALTLTHIGPITPPQEGPRGIADGGVPAGHRQAVSEDLSHVVWEAQSGRVWPFDATLGATALYEYAAAAAQPLLVGVTGGPESEELISLCGTQLAGDEGVRPGRMSQDGRIVFFSARGGAGCVGSGAVNNGIAVPVGEELFARVDGEDGEAHSVAISEPQASEQGLFPGPREECEEPACIENTSVANEQKDWRSASFLGASADDARAFFGSEQQLTDGASEGPGGKANCNETGADCNLYLSECSAQCETLREQRRLIDVSASNTSSGGPRVQGEVAVSEDGSHIYFVAKGVLSEAANGQGQVAHDGADNLYVYERDAAYPAGRIAFIADLLRSDEREWSVGQPANVTPDGRYFVFVSHGDLTPDDTSSSGAQQVFRYDAGSGGASSLTRVSIGEDGFDDDGNASGGSARIAFYPDVSRFGAARRDLTMSDDGSRVFFQSPQALTSKALSGAQNVYEWEREGTGSCPAALSTGCVYLISDGQDASRSVGPPLCEGFAVCLLGSDATGANVFFTTADGLVPKDTDNELDYYDARICEPENGNPCIQEPLAPPAPCDEEACHGVPPAVPPPPATPSSTFNGAGNLSPVGRGSNPSSAPRALTRAQKLANALKVCHKDRAKKKRANCERGAHRKYGSKPKAKKSSDDRRASR